MPHTSNWDFPLGVFVKVGYKLKLTFIAKASLFKPPHGWIFRALGGMPVDRTKSNNFVDFCVDTINAKDEISLAIAPEGTRKKVEKIKTGFYWIARKAQIPIILCKLDFENKIFNFSPPFYTTNDEEKDFEFIHNHFKGVKGKNPQWGI